MSDDQYSRKFVESARLPSRSLSELREALEDGVIRVKRSHDPRIRDEPFSITGLVNSILAWWALQPLEVQDLIAQAGAEKCKEMLKSPTPILIEPGESLDDLSLRSRLIAEFINERSRTDPSMSLRRILFPMFPSELDNPVYWNHRCKTDSTGDGRVNGRLMRGQESLADSIAVELRPTTDPKIAVFVLDQDIVHAGDVLTLATGESVYTLTVEIMIANESGTQGVLCRISSK